MKTLFFIVLSASVFLCGASAQQSVDIEKRWLVKTNLLNALARRPTISIERPLSKAFSAEASFVAGEMRDVFFTDLYRYNGFLLRGKWHFLENLAAGEISPYAGMYIGNLQRNINTKGESIGSSGWLGFPNRHFSAQSMRSGFSLGFMYVSKSRWVIDGQCSAGYGRYLNIDRSGPDTYLNGYLDAQVWLSIGYAF